ncbi:MAG: hypothetical protein QNK11_00545 [Legionella sp.]|nr:hypothetical protein [Legionella sp.]
MSQLLRFILSPEKPTHAEIAQKIASGYAVIPLFEKFPQLKNKTLFQYFSDHTKIKGWTLPDLIALKAVNLLEKNEHNHTLIQVFIIAGNINKVRELLTLGVRLKGTDLALAEINTMKAFLAYRPGHGEPSVFEFCSKRARPVDYLDQLNALILDEADTTDEESSDAVMIEPVALSVVEQSALLRLRRQKLAAHHAAADGEGVDKQLCLVAARGVHFSPKYFKREAINQVKTTLATPKPTYSQSTLFDAGYDADDDVEETDAAIVARHTRNITFVDGLKAKADKKEKKVGTHTPPATRNNIAFESLYARFMQVYINSYSTLFNVGTIKADFGFDTQRNPLVSASWNFVKSAMYGSGFRFDWKQRDLRRDPHYRRFTGKPKHPNMGYLDLYQLDVNYVRTNGFDRQLMCKKGTINLSAFYRAEAEIIFASMIPQKYHLSRTMISLPSFHLPYNTANKAYFSSYGITKAMHTKYKAAIFSSTDKASDAYQKIINPLTERTVKQQVSTVEATAQHRLFKSDIPKAIVYNHGNSLQAVPFKL